LVCNETVSELLRVLAYAKFRLSVTEQKDILTLYLPYAQTVRLPKPRPALPAACRDARDDMFLHLAIAGQAEFLVTGDADLLVMRPFAPVPILTLAELQAKIA